MKFASFYPLIIVLILLTVSFSCKKEKELAILSTATATDIYFTSVTCGGAVSDEGVSAVTARGVCWSTTQNPTTANSLTTNGTGIGSFSALISGLLPGTIYYVRAYAINSSGTSYGNELSFETSVLPIGKVADIDGNVYNTVTIGTQVWMVENLKTTKYNNGELIPNVIWDNDTVRKNFAWHDVITGAYCWYNNDIANKATYGALYNWNAVNDSRKIAPAGWHVATDIEWTTLSAFLGGENVAGGKLKETGTVHWISPNSEAVNTSGFTALPGGGRNNYGDFNSLFYGGYWWSSTESNTLKAWGRGMSNSEGIIGRANIYHNEGAFKNEGRSVRCLKD